MSRSLFVSKWEAALAQRGRNCRKGKRSRNYPSVRADYFIIALLGLQADSTTNGYISLGITTNRWYDHFLQLGVVTTLNAFDELSDFLRKEFPLDTRDLPIFWNGFKHQVNLKFGKGPISSVLKRMCPVDNTVTQSVISFSNLEQLLCMCKKLGFINSSIEQDTIQTFKTTCKRVREFNESRTELPLANDVSRIAKNIINDYAIALQTDIRRDATHGPGSTAELVSALANNATKLMFLHGDFLLRKYADYPSECDNLVPRISELRTVPKNLRKLRTIAKEPVALMWAQQSIKNRLYRYFDAGRAAGVNIRDDTVNAAQATVGSIDGRLSTIDMSAASDSVSLRIFERIFKDSWLYDAAMDTRSAYTRTKDGELIELPMVSTMGSAICFPVETIVFYSIVKAGLEFFGSTATPYVFGDDIVVPTKFVTHIIMLLELYGFVVNIEKSFTRPTKSFRESCGVNSIYGRNVTPIMLSKFIIWGEFTPNGVNFYNVNRKFLIDNVDAFIEFSENVNNRAIRSFIIRYMRACGIGYYTPSRENFRIEDPNNIIRTSVVKTLLPSGRTFVERYVRTPYFRGVQRRKDAQVLMHKVDKSFVYTDELRYFAYWHYPTYDQDHYYIGVDKIPLPDATRSVLATVDYSFTIES